MRSNKILNLGALALDLVSACLVGYLVFYFVGHTLSMLDEQRFNSEVKSVIGNFNDFRSYYATGKIAASPERNQVYQPEVQKAWYCRTATPEGASCEDHALIPYAPFFPVFMSVFAQMPLNVSYVAWSVLGLLAYIGSLCLLGYSRVPRQSIFAPLVISIGALASVPALRCLILGQASLFVTAFIVMSFVCWMQGRERLAGVFMALSTFKIQFVTFTLIPVIAQKKWKILISFLVTEAILWIASLSILGWSTLPDFFSLTQKMGSSDWNLIYTMLCFRSLLFKLPHSIEFALSFIVFLLGLAFIFWLWKRAPQLDCGEGGSWLLAVTLLINLFTSIYTQLYDAMLIGAVAVLTLPIAGVKNVLKPGIASKLWWLVLYTFPLTSWIVWQQIGRSSTWTFHYFTVALMVLLALSFSLIPRLPAASQGVPVDGGSPQ